MSNKSFFKPTNLYKEYMILDLIEKNKDITQREIASKLGISVSMVNMFLERLQTDLLLIKKKQTSKIVDYVITNKGIDRKKVLNIGYLKNAQELYQLAKINIEVFLTQLELIGYKNILLYGSGEVAEILLNSINFDNNNNINIVGVIDDDSTKVGKKINNSLIIALSDIVKVNYDAILISSYTNHTKMLNKLKERQIDDTKIISFF
jgi:DNA-binding MarR family transcriptional regulator